MVYGNEMKARMKWKPRRQWCQGYYSKHTIIEWHTS